MRWKASSPLLRGGVLESSVFLASFAPQKHGVQVIEKCFREKMTGVSDVLRIPRHSYYLSSPLHLHVPISYSFAGLKWEQRFLIPSYRTITGNHPMLFSGGTRDHSLAGAIAFINVSHRIMPSHVKKMTKK